MRHTEGTFEGVRNSTIYYQAWLPEATAIAALLIVHGGGEHSGRYMNLVDRFVPLGYALHGFDHLGHGRSEGAREFVERFEDYTDTLATYHHTVAALHPGKPVFLLGHSLGGLIACSYLLDHQAEFAGAVISAPAIKVAEGISPALITLSKVLSALAPRAGLVRVDASGISRDPAVVQAYIDDPLVFHGKTPARFGYEVLKAMLHLAQHVNRITLPFIVVQGTEDKLVDPGGAQMLYDKAGSTDKTIRLYQGLYHEIFNEPEHAQVLADVEAWLEARL
ncbi:MAG: lysophospholipase [Anaerolineales bacterium]|jgi:alpha-beta hydrolase superfamily lysophospholipase